MGELNIGRRLVRALVAFILLCVLVQVGPYFDWSPQLVRVSAVICIPLAFITPFLPARGRWEVRVYFGLFGLFLLAFLLSLLWARYW
jgi:phage shock protein PspC (stress-responsive transcriptional regulator)